MLGPYDRKKLGRLLQNRRIRKNLRQKDVAAALNRNNSQFISNIKRGTCVTPPQILRQFVHLYEIPPNQIINLLLQGQREYLQNLLK